MSHIGNNSWTLLSHTGNNLSFLMLQAAFVQKYRCSANGPFQTREGFLEEEAPHIAANIFPSAKFRFHD